jgi:hypothetical protein
VTGATPIYLPDSLPGTEVLITVKTYPLPSGKYDELVCTAGLTRDGKWVRVYPVPFRGLPYESQYKKYDWIKLDLVRNTTDFRLESYRPRPEAGEPIEVVGHIGTERRWSDRRALVERELFTSMNDLISLAKGKVKKSLATLAPRDIVDFIVEPEEERDWKPKWKAQLQQLRLFERGLRRVVRKLPYRYFYKILTEGDTRPRKMTIEDWEIGALYWNSLRIADGDEQEANRLVRQRYLDEFLTKKDPLLFVGTTKQYHNVAANPFTIIGVFYPPRESGPQQLSLLPASAAVV